jgi:hypothetical protein
MAQVRKVEEKRRNELTLHARLRLQDKASCLAAGTSFPSRCLHIVFRRFGFGAVKRDGGAQAKVLFVFNSLGAIGRGRREARGCHALAGASVSAPGYVACIPLLPNATEPTIVVSWHMKNTTSASTAARSAVGGQGMARRIGAIHTCPASFVGEVHQAIRRGGGSSGVFRKSRFRVVRTGFDPMQTFELLVVRLC